MARSRPDRKRITLSDAAAARLREIKDNGDIVSKLISVTQPGTNALVSTPNGLFNGMVERFAIDGPRLIFDIRRSDGTIVNVVLELLHN